MLWQWVIALFLLFVFGGLAVVVSKRVARNRRGQS